MAVSLTDVMKNLNRDDVAIFRGGIIPGQGVASILNDHLKGNIRGGKGSIHGGLETRVSRSPNYDFTPGSGGGSYWNNPLAYKSKLMEMRKLSEEAAKNGITTSQQQLMIQQPRILFGRSTDYNAAVLSGIFQLTQVQTRWLISLSKSLGVDNRLTMQPNPDPKKSFMGGLFNSIANDIKRIPGVSQASSFTKHLMNFASIINPMMMGHRTAEFTKSSAEAFQKLIIGKKAYSYMKDPTLATKDAGLKLTDSNKLVNLTKVMANIGIKQLDILSDVRSVLRGIASNNNVNVPYKKLDVMFDEYSGDIKTNFQFQAERSLRHQALTATYQRAYRGSIFGKVTPLIAPAFSMLGTKAHNTIGNIGSKIFRNNETLNNWKNEKISIKDKNFIQILFTRDVFRHSQDAEVYQIMQSLPRDFDFFKKENEPITSKLLQAANDMYSGKNIDKKNLPVFKKIYKRDMELANANYREQINAKLSYSISNLATNLSGKHAPSTPEIIKMFENTERTGSNREMSKILSGFAGSDVLEEYYRTNLSSKLARAIPFLGSIFGFTQQRRMASVENQFDATLRGSTGSINEDIDRQFTSDAFDPHRRSGTKIISGLTTFRSERQEDITVGIINAVMQLMDMRNKKLAIPVNIQDASKDNQQTSNELFDKLRRIQENKNKNKKDNLTMLQPYNPNRKKKEEKKEEEKSSWIMDLIRGPFGKGLLGGVVGTFLMPTLVKAAESIGTYLKENSGVIKEFIIDSLSKLWNLAKENPGTAMATVGALLLPKILGGAMGKVGDIIVGLGSKVLSNPMLVLGAAALGGLVYNITDSYDKMQESGGGFGAFLKEFLIGSNGGWANALGKAGTYAIAGATAGSIVPGLGTLVGFLGGAAIGGIIGGLGMDGIDKYILNSSKIVCELMGWNSGSAEYKLAKLGNFAPYLGPLLFGLIGKIVPDSVLNYLIPNSSEQQEKVKTEEEVAEKEGRLFHRSGPLGLGSENLVLTPDEVQQYQKLKTQEEKDKFFEPIIARERSKRAPQFNKNDRESVRKLRESLASGEYGDPVDIGGGGDEFSPGGVSSNSSLNQAQQKSSIPTGLSSWIEDAVANTIINTFKIGQNFIGGAQRVYNDVFNSGQANLDGLDLNDLGAVSAKFESNGNSEVVAYDPKGGTSYGKYQFASRPGGTSSFLDWVKLQGENGKKIYDTMYAACGGNWNNLNTGSKNGAPVEAWKNLVRSGILNGLEDKYFTEKQFSVALNGLNSEAANLVRKSKPLQQMLWSTVAGHGLSGGKSIFNRAYKSGMTNLDYVNAIYDIRKTQFGGSPPNIRASVQHRLEKERALVISLLQNGGSGITGIAKNAWSGYPNISEADLAQWKVSKDETMVWPSNSNVITSPMGPRKIDNGASSMHMGVDVRALMHSPIVSAMSGVIESIDPNKNGAVVIRHPDGWATRYLHLDKIGVSPGDTVTAGQQIGLSGARGEGRANRWQPHLHFEMMKGNKRVDPEGVYEAYKRMGGQTAYNNRTYAEGIKKSRQLSAKLANNYNLTGNVADTFAANPMDKFAGGDVFGDIRLTKIKKNMNDYMVEKNSMLKESINDEIVKQLKELKATILATATIQQQTSKTPNISITPSVQTPPTTSSSRLGDDVIDRGIDKVFAALGDVLSNFNMAHSNLAITTT